MSDIQPNQYHGRPCRHGHGTLRYRIKGGNGPCVVCARMNWAADRDLKRQRERSAQWRARNPDREHDRYRRWAAQNRQHLNARDKKRKLLIKSLPGIFSDADEKAMFDRQGGLCRFFTVCQNELGDNYHRDHIVPMSKGGTHWPFNRQLLCPTCNARKGTKDQDEFLAEIGLTPERALERFSAARHFPRP